MCRSPSLRRVGRCPTGRGDAEEALAARTAVAAAAVRGRELATEREPALICRQVRTCRKRAPTTISRQLSSSAR
jgi:hypothetical protein